MRAMSTLRHALPCRIRTWHRPSVSFAHDARGTTAVEFGLVGVPFLGLLMALFQSGLYYFAAEGLQVAVQDAARNIYTGIAQAASIQTADAFRTNYLCPASGPRKLPSFIDCSKLIIDVRTASAFNNANTNADFYDANATTKYCPGGPGAIVIVRVLYPMPAIIPVIVGNTTRSIAVFRGAQANNVAGNLGWKQVMMGTAVFMNEPFSASSYTSPTGC